MRTLFLLLLVFMVLPLPASFGQDETDVSKKTLADSKARFDELAAQYKSLLKQYYAYEPKEGEDSLKRFLEHHPKNTMVREFIALEKQSRGTEVGFSCLYHLTLAAGSILDADCRATQGKIAALNILGEHYCDYPDVDTTFRYLFAGALVPESKALLRKLISTSRIENIRANAMYELANNLASEANYPDMCESQLALLDRTDTKNADRIKQLETLIARFENVVDRNREESLSLIDQLSRKYADELVPPRADVRTPVIVKVDRSDFDSILKANRERIGNRLPAVRFELNHSIGQKAPPIDGTDAKGEPMRLSDFHGKVVVVMFSYKGCGPCEAMYPDNRQLIEELSEEPFAFVGVQGDETIDTVRETLDSRSITWRVWWDGEDKRISTQWNIRGWPAIFVLDQRGVIRFRDLRGKELATAVRKLLAE